LIEFLGELVRRTQFYTRYYIILCLGYADYECSIGNKNNGHVQLAVTDESIACPNVARTGNIGGAISLATAERCNWA
jgi:hypothetical protein